MKTKQKEQLKILFFMRNFSGYFRVFEPVIRVLLERGHRIHIAVEQENAANAAPVLRLAEQYPGLTFGLTVKHKTNEMYGFIRDIRLALDYLQYLRPNFDHTPELRARAGRRARAFFVTLMSNPVSGSRAGRAILGAVLRVIERGIPLHRDRIRFIKRLQPDLVMLTPHLMPGSLQPDEIRCAQAARLKTALCVASWDNLSSKAVIRVRPDVVTVWNETQKKEAVELHGIPAERVVVTGAQCFDHWFDWKARPREEFFSRVGLPLDRPYVLYVGGALFPSEITEADFVQRWVHAFRNSGDSRLRDVSILVRPHPKRYEEWENVDFSSYENVAIWPKVGEMPVETEARQDYFDSLYHSAAVVGVNTSAFIEAGIVGRPVHAILAPEFWTSHEGTLHFHYLLNVAGGLLRVSRNLDEHFPQLAEALAGEGWSPEVNRRFVEAFVRPRGLDVAASPVLADELERVARQGRNKKAVLSTFERFSRDTHEQIARFAFKLWLKYNTEQRERLERIKQQRMADEAKATQKQALQEEPVVTGVGHG